MKKFRKTKAAVSVLISLALLLSLTVQASAQTDGENGEGRVYLMGDADLNGEININDVTLVQRALAEFEELSPLQKALLSFDGNDVDISTVTALQRYLADFDTDGPVGDEIVEGADGFIFGRMVLECRQLFDEISYSDGETLWFSSKYDGIPFVNLDYVREQVETRLKKEWVSLEYDEGHNVAVMTTSSGITATFNYAEKYIEFSDYLLFLAQRDLDRPDWMTGFIERSTEGKQLFKLLPQSRYSSGGNFRIELGDEIPMLSRNGDFLIPLSTCNDIFLSPEVETIPDKVYNGKYIFDNVDYDIIDADTGELTDLGRIYFEASQNEMPEALVRFNYYELCLNLDTNYGLMESHKISSFDTYFAQTGLKKELLSGDAARMEVAMKTLINRFFADIHSKYYVPSPYFDYENDRALLDDPAISSTSYTIRTEAMKNRAAIREAALGEVKPYERIGDTVYITFDYFNLTLPGAYYEPFMQGKIKVKDDNVLLFNYANRRLREEDSDAKNVVIDLSCNGGGAVPSLFYLLDATIGKSDVEVYYANTGGFQNLAVKCDLNLDGVVDENDVSFRGLGKNIAVIVSDCSFSCGNAFPVYLKYLDRDVLVLGQTSGGGASFVGSSATAAGTRFDYSSRNAMITRQNGEIRYVDEGVRPDIYLSTSQMYNREYVTSLVDATFMS